jgi:16S rRNA (cytosine1402-N4)-methyltransferase
MTYHHVSVMPVQAVDHLNCRPGKIYVDCTLGGAGHTRRILEKIIPKGLLIGIDQDKDAIKHAEIALKPFESNVRLFHDNYSNLGSIIARLGIPAVDGILLDLGLSLHQLENSGRGFSFKKNEPLDMRMNTDIKITARDIVNNSDENDLAKIFKEYGEERMARRIARQIVSTRKNQPVLTSRQLSDIAIHAYPSKQSGNRKIHPATRIFMALRIAVNSELERLEHFMSGVADMLNPEGRLCVVSFHSLEDRIVKKNIKEFEKECTCPPGFPKCVCNKQKVMRAITKKPVTPDEQEITDNPMSRSAKLRIAEKL